MHRQIHCVRRSGTRLCASGLRLVVCAALGSAVAAAPRPAYAHGVLGDAIRHDASIVVGPEEIEVRLEATFFLMRSLHERRRMDADHDGTIRSREVEAYLAGLGKALEQGLRLQVAGRPVDLIPLHDPQTDLQGDRQVGLGSHLLRLVFFARTPAWLAAGDRITLEDHLWASAPGLCSLDAAGSDGVRIEAEPLEALASSGSTSGQRMGARCTFAPLRAQANVSGNDEGAVSPLPGESSRGPAASATAVPVDWKMVAAVCVIVLMAGATMRSRSSRGGHP